MAKAKSWFSSKVCTGAKTSHGIYALLLAGCQNSAQGYHELSNGVHFDGSFSCDCQQLLVPNSLRLLCLCSCMVTNLTIAQLIVFNFTKCKSFEKSRHSLAREPSLPLYVGIKLHTETRSIKMITHFNDLGLSIRYDRVLEVENQLATADFRKRE